MTILFFEAPPLPYYIAAGESVFRPGDSHPARNGIGLFDLLVVWQGTLFIDEEESSWSIGEGQALVLRPDKSHRSTRPVDCETRFFWLHFHTAATWSDQPDFPSPTEIRPEDDDRYRIEQGLVTRPFRFTLPQYFTLVNPPSVYSLLRELIALEQQPRSWARWQHQILTQNLLKILAEEQDSFGKSTSLQLAERVAIYLRTHYREEMTNAVLKSRFNFHPVYIARCMKMAFGCSPLEYLARYRIEQAKLLLIGTSLSIDAIASEVGFHHQTYFSHTFRKLENKSPSVFRKHFRKQQ
jgi:AraC-like DNA-binding protein